MSLKLNERYPGRFDNPSSQYPQGSFKNRSAPGVFDGSYLEKDWANDKEGMFQSLLVAAGIVPNGQVDTVGASQYFDALLQVIAANAPRYPGQIIWLSGDTAPAGTLKANGAAVSRTVYANLFAAEGTRYGVGNGTTTFNLPDMRGEFPRGWDDGRGVDIGRLLGSNQQDAIQNISGTLGKVQFAGGGGAFSGALRTEPQNEFGQYTTSTIVNQRLFNVALDASLTVRTANETRSRNIALLACVVY